MIEELKCIETIMQQCIDNQDYVDGHGDGDQTMSDLVHLLSERLYDDVCGSPRKVVLRMTNITEEDVRILLSILHDLFPVKTMRVVTSLTPDDVQHFCKRIDLSMPLLKAMLHDRIGDPIPYER